MVKYHTKTKSSFLNRFISGFIAFTFLFSVISPPPVVGQTIAPSFYLPTPGVMVNPTDAYEPVIIQGMTVYPDNPLEFDFIVDAGEDYYEDEALEKESKKLINYFLASLTVPEQDLWVNLSPDTQERIIPDSFSFTEMGRDMLAQDYMLKQLTASLIHPEKSIGKSFWDRVYEKAYNMYGTTEIPLNTFNKVWIVPETAAVYEHENSVFVTKNRLKVMLEEDYYALKKGLEDEALGMDQLKLQDIEIVSGVTSEVVREVLVPELEKEVNEGEIFAGLRQIYNSMLLATWYKRNLKESLLGQVYVDQAKLAGIEVADKNVKEKIYSQYLEALKMGVFNFIKEDYDRYSQEEIPRKYFSGGATGFHLVDFKTQEQLTAADGRALLEKKARLFEEKVRLTELKLSGKRVWKNQEDSTDEFVEAGHDKTVEWINAVKWDEDEATSKAVTEVHDYLNLMYRYGFEEQADLLRKLLFGLLNENLPVGKHGRPQLFGMQMPGKEEIEQLMDVNLPGGHASDRGIHLFTRDAKTLLHELIAFAGGTHAHALAWQSALEKYQEMEAEGTPADFKEIVLENMDRSTNSSFTNALRRDGLRYFPKADNYLVVMNKTDAYIKERWQGYVRPSNLLSTMSESDEANIRDTAQQVSW